jgi:hypothetical protein
MVFGVSGFVFRKLLLNNFYSAKMIQIWNISKFLDLFFSTV